MRLDVCVDLFVYSGFISRLNEEQTETQLVHHELLSFSHITESHFFVRVLSKFGADYR